MTPRPAPPRRVVVSGACGNLGRKVIEALAATPWCERIIGIDRHDDAATFSAEAQSRLTLIARDLTQPKAAWRDALAGADAVVHLAARNPAPDARWGEALASVDMTANLLLAAAEAGVGRFVFASSNHVMGGYKDAPLADAMGPGRLTAELEPAPGTRWHNGISMVDSMAYSTSKVMGERLCKAVAEAAGSEPSGNGLTGNGLTGNGLTGNGLTSVALRIGWNQPGENDPRTINHSGSHWGSAAGAAMSEDDRRALRWYRGMWLSNTDLAALFTAAVTADAGAWPSRHIIVNGVSRNRNTDWELASAEALIGYTPRDDLYDHITPE
jgi:nucleoside-diphosphate-sugar epimerase